MSLNVVLPGVWLSHPWGPSCPAYGGGERIQLTSVSDMRTGATSNSLRFHAVNHIGTHMDAPKHFIEGGRTVDSYSPGELLFDRACLIDVAIASHLRHVTVDHLKTLTKNEFAKFQRCDLLLLRTGAESYRQEERFWSDGPGLDTGLADFIRREAPSCRAIGVDGISITAFSNRELGRKVHREFLTGDRPFFLMEDMALSRVDKNILNRVIVSPLRIEAGDGAPVSVMGFYE